MHPLFDSTAKIIALTAGWLVISVGFSSLIDLTTDASLAECLTLFVPLYFLCLVFILPNYYVCKGLPLQKKTWLNVASSQLLTLIVIVSLWVLIGRLYAELLEGGSSDVGWRALFDENLMSNLVFVILQFEIIVLLHYLFFALEKTRDLERVALQQRLLVSQAELQTLKATVHPHFLFNSLNTLANIALSAPEKAHRFCLLIAGFLRYSVAYSKKDTATLDDELEHIQNYLGIERERFGDRLQIDFSIDDSMRSFSIPPLILFPIVENAIKHGIDSCIEGGTLSISAKRGEGSLIIEVSNPVDELGRKQKGTGHGMASIEQRLKSRYGSAAFLKSIRQSGTFKAQLFFPLEKKLSQPALASGQTIDSPSDPAMPASSDKQS
ncbi:MAG: sensor histidine kinase [Pseudohongiellaceae bacterium]